MFIKNTSVETRTVEHIVGFECDVCHTKYEGKDSEDSDFSATIELQEMIHISFRGGYGSVFGDEAECECHICQHCALKLLGPHIRTVNEV